MSNEKIKIENTPLKERFMILCEFIESLKEKSFEGWSDDQIGGYQTCLLDIIEQTEKLNL